MTALERHNANMEAEIEPEPIERLRFFLSLALTGQDWIDVEQFIDGVSQQLAEREKQVAKAFEAGRQAEREDCAKICDKYTEFSGSPSNFAENCAKAIRARSVK